MNQYLLKIAGELQKHQEKALSRLQESGGVLLHHSTGSGKTRTFLEAVLRDQQGNPQSSSLIVAPASLVTNIDKEINKHGLDIDKSKIDVVSYEKAVRDSNALLSKHYTLAIADEAHRLRNTDTLSSKCIGEMLSNADSRILATATANYNHLADIAPLLNITAGEKLLPTSRKDVENRYLEKLRKDPGLISKLLGEKGEEYYSLKNKKELRGVFDKYVHYYDSSSDPTVVSKFPSKVEQAIEVEMDPEQLKMYKFVEDKLPAHLRNKIRNNLPMDKKELADLNAFATGVRQVSTGYSRLVNVGNVGYTPKLKTAANNLVQELSKTKDFKGLVYSNFIGNGVNEYSRLLSEKGVNHQVYTGSLSRPEKDEVVKRYNSGEVPVLIVSSSGAEGLDLKGTRLIQILDPHFNPSKIRQIVGRGVRYESHAHLPEADRKVIVQHYISVHPESRLLRTPTSIEKYLVENSGEKQEIFDQVKKLMSESSNGKGALRK